MLKSVIFYFGTSETLAPAGGLKTKSKIFIGLSGRAVFFVY